MSPLFTDIVSANTFSYGAAVGGMTGAALFATLVIYIKLRRERLAEPLQLLKTCCVLSTGSALIGGTINGIIVPVVSSLASTVLGD